jgi:hypothetical protein
MACETCIEDAGSNLFRKEPADERSGGTTIPLLTLPGVT